MQEVTEQVGQSKTAAEIGEGERVIRRTETGTRTTPVVGEVERVLAGGKLRVRWGKGYPRFRGGWQTIHSTLSPRSLMLATDENIAVSQRRLYLRMEKGYAADVEEYSLRADAIDARGGDSAAERRLVATLRAKLREVRDRLEGKSATKPLGNVVMVEQ